MLDERQQQKIFNDIYGDLATAERLKSSMVREFYERRVLEIGLDGLDGSQLCCLDLGCGRGIFTRLLNKRFRCVIGTDFAPQAVHTAKQIVHQDSIVFLSSDANFLPFTKNSVDFIVIKDFIHHLDEPQKVLKEIRRILKPEGRLLSVEPNNRNFVGQIIGRLLKHERRYIENSPQFLIRLVESFGFRLARFAFDGFYVPYGPFSRIHRRALPFLAVFEKIMKVLFPSGGGHFIACYQKCL
jgi:ubiquinone/menaquinone biosynthesis C-methylase UbiE